MRAGDRGREIEHAKTIQSAGHRFSRCSAAGAESAARATDVKPHRTPNEGLGPQFEFRRMMGSASATKVGEPMDEVTFRA